MKSTLNTLFVIVSLMASAATGQQPARDQAKGPLRVHPTNPRYFSDGTKNPDGSLRAIYLTGAHTWNNLLDMGRDDPPKSFDFDAYLDFLVRHNHNFVRLWAWGSTMWDTRTSLQWVEQGAIYHVAPQPWQRTGPGQALDGKPKFDLDKFDPAYFERLRARVKAAGQRGIYVSVMLFEGWTLSFDATSWRGHPFRKENNVQGINGDPNGDGKGLEIQTLTIPSVTALQEAYVRKVINTVNDLDNILYEISNEARLLNPASSTKDWQYHLIRFIKNEEARRPKQHPVGMTSQGGGGGDDSEILRNSSADWISPNPDKSDYQNNPPASDGKKVILLDTDHLWGVGGNAAWVWKSFLRGHNPLFMDPYAHDILGKGRPDQWEGARQALGATRSLAKRIDLAKMTPSLDLASTKYCLANPGQEYLVYQPGSGAFSVNLTAGTYASEWFNPATGSVAATGSIKAAGGNQTFTPPFSGPAVLYLKVASAEPGAASSATSAPKLGISGDKFTIGGQPVFLLGVSYFDALGWSKADLDALQARRFNLIRIFLDWGIRPGGNRTRSHFNPDGSMKNTTSLLNFVRACAARGIIVDATILSSDSKSLEDWASSAFPQTAIRNAVRLLADEPNVFFDLVNEHNAFSPTGKMDSWSDSHTTMQSLMTAARQESGSAILTYSSMSAPQGNYAGHILLRDDSVIAANVDEELATRIDVLAPHFGREPDWHDRTDRRVANLKNYLTSRGSSVPVYLQEENRRGGGDATGEPLRNLPKEQFFQAAREAKNAGAAAWLFHTDAGFDMTATNFFDNLDPVEREIADGLGEVVFGSERNPPLRSAPATGPLRVHPTNGRYFADGSGKAIYLTGSHTWSNLQDCGIGVGTPLSITDPPAAFDYDGYLNLLQTNNHNFIRLWRWELPKTILTRSGVLSTWFAQPHPWTRSGPGTANDGKPKFDLRQFDQSYFDRLRSRVIAARDRGIYVGIMLLEGWYLRGAPTSWQYHPFHGSNNVNGINGDANRNGQGEETHTLQVPAVVNLQKAYVRKVIDTVNDLDNVLYEIANESAVVGSTQWQYELINFIKSYQAAKPKQHPVGMTCQAWNLSGDHKTLWNSPADWVSLGQVTSFDKSGDPYISNPPVAPGGKVSILDTDHLGWKVYVNDAALSRAWVWKSFLRGHNPELMEDLKNNSGWVAARAAMGHTRTYANKMNLAAMTPQNDLSTTSYCLANAGREYLVYQPGTGAFALNLTSGNYAFEWFNPTTGSVASTGSIKAAGGNQTFTPPFSGSAVLYLKVASAEPGASSSTTSPLKLGISADTFTIGGQPTFLLGVSYFDALGWSNTDLDAFQARRFNLIRIFLDWSILAIKDNNPSPLAPRGFLNPDGSLKNAETLLNLIRACAARGIMVDVTILNAIYDATNPTSRILDMRSRENAVRNAVRLLKHEPNVFFDVCNEHDVAWNGKTTTLTHAEVAALIRAALAEHPGAIVTVSSGGDHLPNARNTREELDAGVMLVAPHFQRTPDWYDRTDDRVTSVKEHIKSAGRVVPVYLQEEQRRGWSKTSSPPKSEFLQAAREAVSSGAAGWVFHTHAGFDLRSSNFLGNLDPVENEVLDSLGAEVFETVPLSPGKK